MPVAARDVLTPPGTEAAKIDALIDRAVLVVIDVSGKYSLYEAGSALQKMPSESVLIIVDEKLSMPRDLASHHILRRPSDWMASPESLVYQFEHWFREVAARQTDNQLSEPERLLTAREYRAAIIAAVSLLEAEMVRYFEGKKSVDFRPQTIRALTESAEKAGLITSDERRKLDVTVRLRHEAVHRNIQVTRQQANEAVQVIKVIVDRLHRKQN